MLSRVADSIFWTCRYIERAENIARFINVNWHLLLDGATRTKEIQWGPLINITGDEDLFQERYEEPTLENVLRFLAFDLEYPNSIRSCLRAARENARSVRDIISADIWEQVNRFYHMVDEAADDGRVLATPYDFFARCIHESNQFVGLTVTTMDHDEGWNFCRAGRMLERADKTSRILDVKYYYLLPTVDDVGTAVDHVQWSALLRSTSALEAYRRRNGAISPTRAIELLLLDRQFPRSVRYCVDLVVEALHEISGSPRGSFCNDAERTAGQLAADLAYTHVDDLIRNGLHEYLDVLQTRLNDIGTSVMETFFVIETPQEAEMLQTQE